MKRGLKTPDSNLRDFIEQVRAATDIVDVIGKDVDLEPSGSTLKGLSPFRKESSPSFTVWPTTQSWCDFSGGGRACGDVFAYIQQKDGIAFKEAVYRLAKNAGIKPPNQDDTSFTSEIALLAERREIEKLLTKAAEFYHARLPGKIRQNLFKAHYGFSDTTIDDLRLGWANGYLWDYFIKEQGIAETLALKTGLFIKTKEGVRDFFRNRLVFPYWKRLQVVYFIARATELTGDEKWEQAKYKKLLTHSEKRIYVSTTVRNDFFYNEDSAENVETMLITEGVTDCISAMQADIPCVSPVTTRFRKKDIPKLLTLTQRAKRVIICNDNETSGAGAEGALDTAEALIGAGKDIRIATLPLPEGADKIDVNEFLKQQGKDKFRAIIDDAKLYIEFLIDRISDGDSPAEIQNQLEPVLRCLNRTGEIELDRYLDLISKRFKIGRDTLKQRMKHLRITIESGLNGSRRNKPIVKTNHRHPDDLVEEARALVFEANNKRVENFASGDHPSALPILFCRDEQVVRLKYNRLGTPELVSFTETEMFGLLIREVDWVAIYEEGTRNERIVPDRPPKYVGADLLANPPDFPKVDTVITTPVFDKNGELMIAPGLHTSEYTWMHPDPELALPEIPQSPTQTQIADAKSIFFDDLLVDFPFVDNADRINMLAAILLPFIRRMIQGCTPLHVVEAPSVGSGKSKLCQLAAIISTGKPCDGFTLPDNEEEVRKTLTAEFINGNTIIAIDNTKERKRLDSQALASVLTAASWRCRVLGKSEMVVLPNRAVWMLTGNNPKLSTELARRSIRIRIDPKTDRAWQREDFKHKHLIAWAIEHRSELVHAALVLAQAWIAAGKPLSEQHLGSFEHWSAVMGGILQVIETPDFLANLDEMYAHADAEGDMWREFTAFWWATFRDQGMKTSELNEFCEKHDLLQLVRGDGTERSQQVRLGNALQNARDRVFSEYRIELRHDGKHKGKLYSVVSVKENAHSEEPNTQILQFPPTEDRTSIDPFEIREY